MPAAQFIQDGDAIDYIPVADTPAGTVVVQGDLLGVTKQDIAAGERGALALTGVFQVSVEIVGEWSIGAKAYWYTGEALAMPSDEGSTLKYLGKTVALIDNTTIQVRLEQ